MPDDDRERPRGRAEPVITGRGTRIAAIAAILAVLVVVGSIIYFVGFWRGGEMPLPAVPAEVDATEEAPATQPAGADGAAPAEAPADEAPAAPAQ